jgi:hypothetical protein
MIISNDLEKIQEITESFESRKIKGNYKMKFNICLITILVINLLFCTKNDNPVKPNQIQEGNGNLLINIIPDAYSWSTVDSGEVLYLSSNLTNLSDDVYYSRVGDRFNAALDQDHLSIASNTNAFIEMHNNDNATWEIVNCAVLIEGSRFVSIIPNKTYTLDGCIPHNQIYTGKFRIRIDYYNNIEPTTSDTVFKDYSNTFTIKN